MPVSPSAEFVSVAAWRQYLHLAQARGLDVASLCREAGLSQDLAQKTSGTIAGADFQRFLSLLLTAANDPLLGLHVGDFVEPGSYSVLGYITMSCTTLGEAIERITPYERLVGDLGVTRLQRHQDQVELQWSCGYTCPQIRHHVVDNVFSSWINYGRWLCNRPELSPSSVDLEHAPPAPEYVQAYSARWNCRVRFLQPLNRIRLSPNLLTVPLRQPDPELRQTLEDHARSRMVASNPDQAFAIRVRSVISQQLRAGVIRQDLLAQELSLSSRTLQRKLAQEGVSYQGLVDELREQLAREYLLNMDQPLADIAIRLGFSDTRSFHRRFKLWTGMTPAHFRREQRKR